MNFISTLPLDQFSRTPAGNFKPLPVPLAPIGQSIDALYVHVPFCTVKCHYCDFFSVAGHLDQADDFLQALARESELQIAHFGPIAPKMIFVGGGTPTLLAPQKLERLLQIIVGAVSQSQLAEFTFEANPNTFDPARAAVLARYGVNRISFGAQSFVPAELAALQRDHLPASVPAAVHAARTAGIQNINLDLIFGIPGQTPETWSYSLQQALACNPSHMSCYSLMYEPNTPLTARLKAGQIKPMDDAAELQLLHLTRQTLHSAGLQRYEISNYAQPGRECRHNLLYWNGGNHLAWGPAAWAHVNGARWKNVASLGRYIQALNRDNCSVPIVEIDELTGLKRWGELAILQLRLTAGMNWAELSRRSGVDVKGRLKSVLAKYDGMGLLEDVGEHLRLTDRAISISDTILADVLAALS